jgi:hypothetical protein
MADCARRLSIEKPCYDSAGSWMRYPVVGLQAEAAAGAEYINKATVDTIMQGVTPSHMHHLMRLDASVSNTTPQITRMISPLRCTAWG